LFEVKPFTKHEKDEQLTTSNLNQFYYHKLSETHHFLGAILDNNFEGIGVTYNPVIKRVTEVGMYHNGKLNGYCLKIESKTNHE